MNIAPSQQPILLPTYPSKRVDSGHFRNCIWAILALLALTIGHLQAQPELIKGNTSPPIGLQSKWYFDSLTHQLWERFSGKYLTVPGPFADVEACGKLVVMHKLGENGVDMLGWRYWHHYESWNYCECQDSIAWAHEYRDDSYMRFYTQDGRMVGWAFVTAGTYWTGPQCFINGIGGFCCTTAPLKVKGIEDVHGWGILGTHGRWLIPPQYDAPFSFQDGFAEVIYYGQRKKINEMGAFVESSDGRSK